MPYIKSVCIAGKTKEIEKYYARYAQPLGGSRQVKQNKTTEKQQVVNNRQLIKKLTRILNANFDSTSYYITFSYKEENRPTGQELKSQIRELLKKMRRAYKAERKELKYVETAEKGERGATHIHMVINEIDIRKIVDIWKYGYVSFKPLDKSGQYRKLAAYFIKYFQKTKGTDAQLQKKAYNCSRNLARPEVRKTKMYGRVFKSTIEIPAGWYLDKESYVRGINEYGYEYLSYTLIRAG